MGSPLGDLILLCLVLRNCLEKSGSLKERPGSPVPMALAWCLLSSGYIFKQALPTPTPSTGLFSGMDNVVYLFSQIFGLGNLP